MSKFIDVNFYENAIKLIESPIITNGIYSSVEISESTKDIFSKDKLIDDRYYYIQYCNLNGSFPSYRTKVIKILSEYDVKKRMSMKVLDKLEAEFRQVDMSTYKIKGNLYLHKLLMKSNDILYNDSETGYDYLDSKLILLDRAVRYLNHLKYEYSKRSKKKDLFSDIYKRTF